MSKCQAPSPLPVELKYKYDVYEKRWNEMLKENRMIRKFFLISLSAILIFTLGLNLLSGENKIEQISKHKPDSKTEYSPEQEFLFKTFKTRRSVRKFKSEHVPKEHILKILDMARTAPTSGNQQPWKFLVITEEKKIDELKSELIRSYLERLKKSGTSNEAQLKERKLRMESYYSDYLSAPVNIVVLTDSQSKYPAYNKYDGPLAAGYLMLAARSLGYGTVFATDSIPPAIMKKVFNIPENFEIVCFTPLGVPETWPESKQKKPLKEFIVFNKFIEGVNYVKKRVKKTIKLDEKILEKYTGTYKLNDRTSIIVSLKESQLFIQVTGQPQFPIFAETENMFFLKVVDASITFNAGANGNIKNLTLKQSGKEFTAERTE